MIMSELSGSPAKLIPNDTLPAESLPLLPTLPVALHWEKKKILCGLCKKVHSIDRKESGKFSAENLIPKIFSIFFFGVVGLGDHVVGR